MRFHLLRDLVKENVIDMAYYGTQDQIADILTKPLKLDTFVKMTSLLGMCEGLEGSKLAAGCISFKEVSGRPS